MATRAYDEAMDAYVASLAIPAVTLELIGKARHDLYNGPSYYDADGEECSCFDDGAIAFDFVDACSRIDDALAEVSGIWIDLDAADYSTTEPEPWEDEDGELYEPDYSCWQEVSASEVIRHIVGHELARYI
jgi:hypothetical protein